jgi:predicted SPOUT superfamily RNA methylase MTH1
MQKRNLSIAIPASIVSDTPHLREKTSKIGLIGRAAAIFRVGEIVIYPDNPNVGRIAEMNSVATLLSYMETPQYLRKKLFKLKPELQYAGILPPLRTPHHPLNRRMKNLKVGEYREGVAVSKTRQGTLVDIGVEDSALASNKQLTLGKRFTVKIVEVDKQVKVRLADRGEIPEYWGYEVVVEDQPLGKIVEARNFDLTIATSKYGSQLSNRIHELAVKWKSARAILVSFGAPTQGLHEILKYEQRCIGDAMDFVVNMIPMQGTETVRAEEAIFISLATLYSALQQNSAQL